MGKEIQFIFDTSYNTLAVDMKMTEFEGKVLKVSVIDTMSHLKIAEFIRISDSAYFYQSYNNEGKTTAEGEAIVDKIPFNKIKTPIYNQNGEEVAFKYWGYYKFHKSGKWFEEVTDSLDRYGSYLNNKKTGDWFYTKLIAKTKGIPLRKEIYKNDSLMRTESLNLLEGNISEILKKVCGKWEIINTNGIDFSDTIFYFRKMLEKETRYVRNYVIITQDGKGYMFIGGHHFIKRDFTWSFITEDKNIVIRIPDIFMKCKTTFLSKELMVGVFSELRMISK